MSRRRSPGGSPRSRRAPTPSPPRPPDRRYRVIGVVDVVVALLLLAAVWLALPARVVAVDVAGSLAAGAFLVGGGGLLAGASWAPRAALAAGGIVLLVGIVLMTTLTWTASHLVGLYGPVGGGGALILVVVAALLLPYLVILPAAQVWLLLPESHRTPESR